MSKIMACTVAAPTERNKVWARLQSSYLDKTKHVEIIKKVAINGAAELPWVNSGYSIVKSWNYNKGHLSGLLALTEAFKSSDCDWFLTLDSDAWPITDDWFIVCERLMSEKGKLGVAIVRCENFDTFPHPCALMAHRTLIEKGINFNMRPQINMLGDLFTELSTNYVDFDRDFLPMVRTNKINFHPLFGGIYGHMFYHHGAGSRSAAQTRLSASGMYDHFIKKESHAVTEEALFKALSEDHDGLIKKMMDGISL